MKILSATGRKSWQELLLLILTFPAKHNILFHKHLTKILLRNFNLEGTVKLYPVLHMIFF